MLSIEDLEVWTSVPGQKCHRRLVMVCLRSVTGLLIETLEYSRAKRRLTMRVIWIGIGTGVKTVMRVVDELI